MGVAALSLFAVLGAAGCSSSQNSRGAPPASTTIELGEVTNIGYTCGSGAQFSWTARARETGDEGTAGCQQPVDFVGYEPGATYTFDITGYDGSRVCWQGTCSVLAQDVDTTYADCSGQIAHLCGY